MVSIQPPEQIALPSYPYVVITPGVLGGAPRIDGTRISVSHVVLLTESGRSPDQIAVSYPQLSLSQIHAALGYYFDHKEQVDELIRRDQDFVNQFKFATSHGRAS